MKCPSCGKENPASEQYCLDCGSDLNAAVAPAGAAHAAPAAAAQPAGQPADGTTAQSYALSDDEFQKLLHTPPADQKCPHCGAAAPAGGTFCDNCGESLAAAPAGQSANTAVSVPVATPVASVPADQAAASAPVPADPALKPTQAIPSAAPAGAGVNFEYEGPTSQGRVAMTGDEVKIGRRDADAGIYPELDFDGNDLVVDAGERVHAVSRRHARVFRDGGDLKFEDLGSTNGSTLNGTAVLAHDPQPLNDGDRIVLGRTCRITVHVS